MRQDEFEVSIASRGAAARGGTAGAGEPSLGELLKRLTGDTAELVRQEAALAKAELREAGSVLAADGAKIGVAVGLALAGVLSLTAFLVLALGRLLDGAFWLSALLVGLALLAVGGVLARNAIQDVKRRGLAPRRTIATLRDDQAWAAREARDLRHDLTGDRTASPTQR